MSVTRVVVVGNGMVGSRFVEELLGRVAGDARESLSVTVLGAEEHEPYNRVLLSEVVAGKVDVASITLPSPAEPRPTVLRGVAAVRLDRAARVVHASDGGTHPYDVLVLATGARARVPALPGLEAWRTRTGSDDDALPAGVHALRTLDDAREIVAATLNARRAVVLGGGVLGLEAACGLARRGVAVTVVHGGPHLMERQLDDAAAAAVGRGLDRLGIAHRVATFADDVVLDDDGRLTGLRVRPADGTAPDARTAVVPADLLVMTAGTLAETSLAADAGLAVRRGVVVGPDLATADPAVLAIGDCAEPPEGGSGLVAQGWDQARRLAAALADGLAASGRDGADRPAAAPADGAPGTDLVRVKAHGLDVVAMGVCGPDDGPADRDVVGRRSLALSDPRTGRHVEVVVAGGVVVGATCVGDPRAAADLTTAYTRRTPVPADPAHLLLPAVRGAAVPAAEPSPTLMPDRATVCRCNGVTKGEIVTCWHDGARDVPEVARRTRATTGCGGCTDAVCGIVDWLARSEPGTAGDEPAAVGARRAEVRSAVPVLAAGPPPGA
ncbi:FAD-dependent oxidoreductase [Actinotalea sp. Marseille-Q4924]|uniref:FAD-dependent oxidoreductase n=1 Tax=Actinotalea sp. Marseille-Q4924 TaxID=2866571 RepID=UPI001CE3F26B|nr:FAD-dependent oxidoreductase [Actinotalea sp. Marseille-Q4924]